jgi:hypothetical protein
MSSPRSDFAVLLASPDRVEADLAKDLLASKGIPSMLHGQYQDLVGLGYAGPISVARPDLLVPISALERAHEILSESWDADALTDEVALAYPVPEEVLRPSSSRSFAWGLFVGLVAIAFILTYARYFWPRSLRTFFE